MMNQETTKWIPRIRVMLAKSASTDSPHEAVAFADKARQLMVKYSITEEMLEEPRRFRYTPPRPPQPEPQPAPTTRTRTSHRFCDHDNTKSARAKCRRSR